MKYYVNSNFDKVTLDLSQEIFTLSNHYIKATGSCIIALSGGSTPIKLYQQLAEQFLHLEDIHRKKIIFIQVDERWVPSDHERSNQNMISNIFTPNHYNFVPFPHVGINSKVSHSTTEYNNHITEIIKNTGKNAIDIIILGMGDDGHTASLFPLNPDYIKLLGNNTETISFSTFVNEQNELRLSLSPNFIINATNRFLLISGANKGKVLNNVFKINDNKKYPIQIAFDNKTSVYLDQICYQQLELNNNS